MQNSILKNLLKLRWSVLVFWAIAYLFIIFAVVGGFNNYSPVPSWDMWNGYLEFFTKFSNGDFLSLCSQHNEHRIIISKLLFWLDIAIFGGSGIFLITLNYVFVFIAFLIFFLCAKEILENENHSAVLKNLIGATILILLFSWTQKENFVWAFQSQFFLAQLLPLMAFYLLHKSYKSDSYSLALFLLSCFVGLACAGTMANGIIALPLMVLLSLIFSFSLKRVSFLVLLSALTISTYFYNYISPPHHGSLKDALLNNPIGLVQYVFSYLGNPFHHISSLVAQIMGFILVSNSVFFSFKYLRKRQCSSLQLSLLTFILYIGITAVGTGGGRLTFGIEQAFSSRYSTPVLMAWSALLVLYASIISAGLRKNFTLVKFLPMLVLLILLPKQLQVFDQNEGVFESKVAALALEINVKDEVQLKHLYPDLDVLLSIAKIPIEKNLSIFGNPLIKDVGQLIGLDETAKFVAKCTGNLEKITAIDGEEKYLKIEGWILEADLESAPKIIHVADENKKIIGYALVGKKRTDIKKLFSNKAKFSGFKGYLLKNSFDKKVVLNGIDPNCSITLETNLTK